MPSGLSAAPGSRSTSPCEVIGSSSPGGPSVLTPAGPCRPAPAFQQYRMLTSANTAKKTASLSCFFVHYTNIC